MPFVQYFSDASSCKHASLTFVMIVALLALPFMEVADKQNEAQSRLDRMEAFCIFRCLQLAQVTKYLALSTYSLPKQEH